MKKTKEFWVEYDFEATLFGERANRIWCFRDKAEAEAFAATKADSRIVEIELTEN
jgi:hypothetical protein